MQYQTTWLDIVYEATFSTPAFRLARENIEVLSILFKHLAPQYSVRPSDMHVSGGTALSDVKARISLFTGNGVLEITADKFSATFTNAVGQQDIETIKDCIATSLSALTEWLPNLTYKEHVFRITAFLSLLSDCQTATDDFLNGLMANKMVFRHEDFGASKVHYGVRADFENSRENWIVGFDISPSLRGNTLITNSSARYQGDSAITTLEDKAAHIQSVFTSFLTTIGLVARE